MTKRESTEQAVLDAVAARGEATVEEVAKAAGIGKTSARKHLARLHEAGEVRRNEGGREGRRKLPDRYAPRDGAGAAPAEPEPAGGGEGSRLRPGQLDGLVLDFLAERASRPLQRPDPRPQTIVGMVGVEPVPGKTVKEGHR